MHYREITVSEKQNIAFSCVPFCIESNRILAPDCVHVHAYHQLTLVTGGSALLVVNNQETYVSECSVYIIGSHAPHHLTQTSHIEVINILFRLDDLMKSALSLQLDEGFRSLFVFQAAMENDRRPTNILRLNPEDLRRVLQLTDAMQEEMKTEKPGRDILIQSYFMILITTLSRGYHRDTIKREPDAVCFNRLISYMQSHFCDPLTLEDLERESGLGEHKIRRYFSSSFHLSPIQYLIDLRLESARRYLSHSSMSVTEIALGTGFHDSNYFSRKFKQAYGITPREFRRQNQDK